MALTSVEVPMVPRFALIVALSLLAACGGGGGGGKADPGGGDPSPVAVSVTPASISLTATSGRQFSCVVTGSTQTGCTWSVIEAGGGLITTAGLYTAPGTPGVYHVQARSVADPARTATAEVTVTAAPAAKPWVTGYYVGYYWDWDLAQPPQSLDMSAMTHLVLGRVAPGSGSLGGAAGALVLGGGQSFHGEGRAPDGSGRDVEDYMVARAHAAGTKVLLMLGGDGDDGKGFLRSTTDALRPTFVRRVVDYLVEHDYDGVDVDWENELDGNSGMGVTAEEARRRLKALLSELRLEAASRERYRGLERRLLITHPGYPENINFLLPGGKVEPWKVEVAALVDQYNLMSYGVGTAFNGAEWESWFSGPIFGAGPNRPIDLDSSIRAYVASGVPRGKLGVGIGFYGMYYGPSITGPRQDTNRNDIWNFDDNALAWFELVRKGYLSHGQYHWDAEARVGYRTYGPGGYVPANDPASDPAGFLTYEDERSIAAKGAWVRETGLGGTIIWTVNYGYDVSTGGNPLLAATKTAFLQ
ncbi:glycosyl hydrolase family 18 protein [Brevundimonas sp. NPDC092305]|uniref:glycosyl hydrolase family 18 protein n=1 Tax=Brevundimonas sp. NPDC092305 TaxID=3363957 RepID=UPI0037FBFC08